MFYWEMKYKVSELPKIITTPPGPKSRKIIMKDKDLLMQSFTRWYPLVVKTGLGPVIEDVDGNLFIDLNSGIAVMNVGHNHPKIVEAIKKQSEKLLHYSLTDFLYEEAVKHAEALTTITPILGKKKVFYTNSGAESNEGAIKIIRGFYEGRRPYIISFIGAFHGRTIGALTLNASKTIHKKRFSPLLPNVIHAPYPYCYRCPFKQEYPNCNLACVEFIEEWVLKKVVDPEEVGAIFFEPIQGEGGYIVPPQDFFKQLRKLANNYDIKLVDDEVQTGFGRTGKWFAIEYWGVEPDIITMAKAIASGLPLGAIVGRSEIMSLPPGSHATTFGGNPISLSASLEVINIIKNENLLDNALKVGAYALKRLNEIRSTAEIIGDVRGKGLMIGIELVKNERTKEPATKAMVKVIERSFKKGVAVIGAGISTIRIAPPLVINIELMEKALSIIEEVLKEVSREEKSL